MPLEGLRLLMLANNLKTDIIAASQNLHIQIVDMSPLFETRSNNNEEEDSNNEPECLDTRNFRHGQQSVLFDALANKVKLGTGDCHLSSKESPQTFSSQGINSELSSSISSVRKDSFLASCGSSESRFCDIKNPSNNILIKQNQLDRRRSIDPVTFVTNCIVCRLVKQTTICLFEVSEILQRLWKSLQQCNHYSTTCSQHSSQTQPEAYNTSIAPIPSHPQSCTQPGFYALCSGVAARLAALCDHIRLNGTAVLPPSRAVMGPPFVPALQFLRGLVLQAAAAGTDDGASSARKRRRPDSDNPEPEGHAR